jgi:ligand-binding sensor domain-containing protein
MVIQPGEDGVLIGTEDGWFRSRTSGRPVSVPVTEIPVPLRQLNSTAALRNDPAASAVLNVDPQLRRFRINDAVPGERTGEWWIATEGGLFHFDGTRLNLEWVRYGTPSFGVGAVALDGDRIWFGGDARGPLDGVATATTFDDWRVLETLDGAPGGFVARIAPAPDAIWFAASDGLYRLDRRALTTSTTVRRDWTRWTSARGLPTEATTSLALTTRGIWVGTFRGLVRINPDGAATETLLTGRRVLDLSLRNDTLWIASENGLWLLPGASAERPDASLLARPSGLTSTPELAATVVAIIADAHGVAALTPRGVYQFDGSTWSSASRALVGIGSLYRLARAADGTLWVTAEQAAAARNPTTGAWQTWLVPSDIPSGPVRGIALAGNNVWLATPIGAVRMRTER